MHRLVGQIVGFVFAAFMATGCQTVDLTAAPQQSNFMLTSNAQVAPPAGFISFCLRNPDQCTAAQDQAEAVALNQHTWDTLRLVNEHINQTVRFEDDARHFGRAEYWTIATDGYGDCDDYALTKRKELIDAGLPERALRIATVRTRDNVGHAVLTVATDHGDYVLDNLAWDVVPWDQTHYTWISRQDASNPMDWVSLQAGPTKYASAR